MILVYILGYLFFELLFTIEFGARFGVLATFFEIIVTFFIGGFILKNLQFNMQENIVKLTRREISKEEFISLGLFKLIGAILLMIPGIFTDIIGILMQFEFFAKFFADKFLKTNLKNSYNSNNYNSKYQEEEIIDVEVIEERKK